MRLRPILLLVCFFLLSADIFPQAQQSFLLRGEQSFKLTDGHVYYAMAGNFERGFVLVSFNGNKEISIYHTDKDFKVLSVYTEPMKVGKYWRFEKILFFNERFYLYFSDYNKAGKANNLIAREVLFDSGLKLDQPRNLLDISLKKPDKFSSRFEIRTYPNGEISFLGGNGDYNPANDLLNVFDERLDKPVLTLNGIRSDGFYRNGAYYQFNPSLKDLKNPSNDVFFSFSNPTEGNKPEVLNKDEFDEMASGAHASSYTVNEYFDYKSGRLFVGGMLLENVNPEQQYNALGFYYIEYNPKDYSIVNKEYFLFSDKFIERCNRDMLETKNYLFKDYTRLGAYGVNLTHCFPKKNGGFYFVFSHTLVVSGGYSYEYKRGLVIANTNHKNQLVSVNTIPMFQEGFDVGPNNLDPKVFFYNESLYVLFLDNVLNKSNMEAKYKYKIGSNPSSETGAWALFGVKVTEDLIGPKEILFSQKSLNSPVIPSGFSLDDEEGILFHEIRKPVSTATVIYLTSLQPFPVIIQLK